MGYVQYIYRNLNRALSEKFTEGQYVDFANGRKKEKEKKGIEYSFVKGLMSLDFAMKLVCS